MRWTAWDIVFSRCPFPHIQSLFSPRLRPFSVLAVFPVFPVLPVLPVL
jgi:hypothetical protein